MDSTAGPAPDPPGDQEWHLRLSPPENELPVPVAVDSVLGRTEEVAVSLTGMRVFTSGVQFEVAVRLRRRPDASVAHRLHELLGGSYHGEPSTASHLLLGVEYADGRTATNVALGRRGRGVDGAQQDARGPTAPVLRPHGGGGGEVSYDQTFWLSPVPPPGPLTFVIAWQLFGIAETHTAVDGTAIAAASRRAQVLWPRPTRGEDRVEEPPEPVLPASGWFWKVVRGERGDAPRGP